MIDKLQTVCVIAPCYNEAEGIEHFYDVLKSVLVALPNLDHRILFVDDGSRDATLDRLNTIAAGDARVLVYSLSRNFGHQVALSAGIDKARADAIIMMDSDLQHPPDLIPEMVRLWRAGNDVVSAVRQTTSQSALMKRLTSKGFYWMINVLSDTPIIPGAADFCLLSRKAHRTLRQMPERHRFLRGMVSWIGFKRASIPFEAPGRIAGYSKYTALKMLRLAADATFSFSVVPIRLASRLGIFTVVASLIYLVYILVRVFHYGDAVPGWASQIFVTVFLGGVQLAFIGVLGEYLARVFEEVKRRPVYILKQTPARASRRLMREPVQLVVRGTKVNS
jgi:dolichol-phosphate mannosyltransferase